MQSKIRSLYKLRRSRLLLGLLLVVVVSVVGTNHAAAAVYNNYGPNPQSMGATGNPSDVDEYVLTSSDNSDIQISTNIVPIYYHTKTGTKSITIYDGNLCTDPVHSAPAQGNYSDHGGAAYNTVGATASTFYVTPDVARVDSSPPVSSVVDDDHACYAKQLKLTFDGSKLQFDPDTRLYFGYFHADIAASLRMAQNRYRIVLDDPTAIVGYSHVGNNGSFGIGRAYPADGYRNYAFPFAPDCSVPNDPSADATDATAIIYDMDQGNTGIQGPLDMVTHVDESPADGTSGTVSVPVTFTKGPDLNSTPVSVIGGPDGYTVTDTTNQLNVYIHFKVKGGYRYVLHQDNVYYKNNMQFQLPFDSIYYDSLYCPQPQPQGPTTNPFFDVIGGDIVAGAAFMPGSGSQQTVCSTANVRAGIVSWNQEGPSYTGAGGQYAAFAMSRIQDFVSSSGLVSANAPPSGLTFSNQNNAGSVQPSNGLFGGMFGNAPCIDLWGTKPAWNRLTTLPNGSLGGVSGSYKYDHDLTLNGMSLSAGQHLTIYVDGDVSITGNIYYPGLLKVYSDRSEIPSFQLIVHGAIFIGSGVTELNGMYAAIPDQGASGQSNSFTAANPGTISTCSHGFSSYNPGSYATSSGISMQTQCGQGLLIRGSIAAQQIWLLRTAGDVATGVPAEVFAPDPTLWLAAPDQVQSGQPYDLVTNLPPVL